ncbi:hypothetical protein BDW22DRAFT_1349153 [Trametopsis cervina]|nr:hypothetical protein BDW22DRAFT_1349153 [Trametopsis cervina]
MSDDDDYGLYQWSEEELQIPIGRHWKLHRDRLDLLKRVRTYHDEHGTLLVLKSIDNALLKSAGGPLSTRMELDILQRLLAISSSRNHTIPAEIITCSKTSIIVMPYLREAIIMSWDSLDTLTDVIWQVLQGLEFMHENGIAHFDVHLDNLVVCCKPSLPTSLFPVEQSKCYFIDFGSSKQLPPPPRGGHGDIYIPFLPYGGHYDPPEGRERVNPYAYDIYSTGQTALYMCKMATFYARRERDERFRVPPALREFCRILANDDTRMRPTASRSMMLLRITWRWNKMTQWLYWFAPYHVA